MQQSMLTTLDNPYNPWTHFDEWYNYDLLKGYDSCGKLARLAPSSSDALPEEYTDSLKEIAIDSIIEMYPNIYTRVYDNVSDSDFEEMYKTNRKKFDSFANESEEAS